MFKNHKMVNKDKTSPEYKEEMTNPTKKTKRKLFIDLKLRENGNIVGSMIIPLNKQMLEIIDKWLIGEIEK